MERGYQSLNRFAVLDECSDHHTEDGGEASESSSKDAEESLSMSQADNGSAPLETKTPRSMISHGRKRSFVLSAKDFVTSRTDNFEDHYEIFEMLGEGFFGEVYACKKRQNGSERRAVKIIQKDRMLVSEYEQVINEFQILRQLDNPNIIRTYEFYDTKDNFYIVQELMQGGELYDYVAEHGRLSEQNAAHLMKEVLLTVKYLAQNNVLHRDVNLENILLESNKNFDQIKLIDFGLATSCSPDEKLTEMVGKTHYLAPELLDEGYGQKYDVWSSGVLAYICLSGFAPFDADSESDIRSLIMEGNVSFADPEWQDVSEEAKDFVKLLLTYDPEARPTAGEALTHPWIVNALNESKEEYQKHPEEVSKALSNMRSFCLTPKLKQAAGSYVASQLLHKAERDGLDRLFRGMDGDCDGKLSINDLQGSFRDLDDSGLTYADLEDVFQHCDQDGSGFIDYSEFIAALSLTSEVMDEGKVRAVFDNFAGKSGFISAKKLKELLAHCQESDVEKMIDELERDGEGMITFEVFREMMNSSDGSLETETTRTEDDDESLGF